MSVNLFILSFGSDEVDSCRFLIHPEVKSIDEFESDRLEGVVSEETVRAEELDVTHLAEQLARLHAKGSVDVPSVFYCNVGTGVIEEL
jgi:hypothetical protein